MNKKIIAIVVTYNRCSLLERCINYLNNQTLKPDEILVINNGSNDGTLEMLKKLNVTIITQENVGSAGGWHAGLEFANKRDYDFAWLMDDDGYPDIESLGILSEAFKPGIACISSLVVQETRPSKFVFPLPKMNSKLLPVVWSLNRKLGSIEELNASFSGNLYPFAHLFNGALIKIDAVRAIGNVNKDFFMFGDEVDYFFRLRKYGGVFSATNSYHFHPDVSKRKYSGIKIYYYIKNSIILNTKYFDLIIIRNVLTLFAVIIRTGKRNGLGYLFDLVIGKHKRSFYRAIFRGLQGKVRKDFND